MTPQPAQADPRAQVELDLRKAISQRSIGAVIDAGTKAQQMGMRDLAELARAESVGALNQFIAKGDAEGALTIEGFIYKAFVKAVEDEGHYESVFGGWREPMAALGRRAREPFATPADAAGIGFVFHSGAVLGHTEVLFRLLEYRDRGLPVRIYAIGAFQPEFLARAAALGVPVETFPNQAWGRGAGFVDRLRWIRARMAKEGVRTAVWVSYPATAIYALAMGLAPVQVMWSLRYHPVRLPEIDGYLTYGSWGEDSRVFHGQRWTVCPVPLALDPRTPVASEVAALRARFPEKVLLGTLAREEKIDSAPFLESVAAILKRNPQCGYVWTGLARHPGIAAFFERQGVGARCHFVGWVDTPLYAAILDAFLETFPLGCGITGYQAIGAGVPLISYLDSNTVFGMQYWHDLMARAGGAAQVTREMLDEYPLLTARDPFEYAELATRVITDAAFRDAWREREQRFYAGEIAGIARYAQRFFAAITAVAERKAA